ncbi:MAG TPA: FIST N-terminal domain-containing protein [Albitalea sp.]|nr:FIST N-terminal domain-containing protein [Albitalea sp.]
MKTLQLLVETQCALPAALAPLAGFAPDLVLCFGAHGFFRGEGLHAALRRVAPAAVLAGCSSAGEILQAQVHDGTLAVTALAFDAATARGAATTIAGMGDSFAAGQRLGAALPHDGLRQVLVFGTGVHINGSALVEGLRAALPPAAPISGGLAGDGGAFVETFTLADPGAASDQIAAVGLYGEALTIGNSSLGGWVPFGPARRVTRCAHNVLFELDGESALNIYKRYLGPYAGGLPASGLLFPFELMRDGDEGSGIIRTILGIDVAAGSLTLAGDVPEGGLL